MAAFGKERGARFRLFYILRNPIDRIESHIAHNLARREKARARGGLDVARMENAIAVSRYASQLDRLMRRFSREDVLILDFDELRSDPQALAARAFAFLGLDPLDGLEAMPPANPRREAAGEFRLADDQRASLREALREDVTALRDRYGVAVDKWGIL
jgi:hypothetical protein